MIGVPSAPMSAFAILPRLFSFLQIPTAAPTPSSYHLPPHCCSSLSHGFSSNQIQSRCSSRLNSLKPILSCHSLVLISKWYPLRQDQVPLLVFRALLNETWSYFCSLISWSPSKARFLTVLNTSHRKPSFLVYNFPTSKAKFKCNLL